MDIYIGIWMLVVVNTCNAAVGDTSDHGASMRYVVHNVPTVDDPFEDIDQGVVKRTMQDDVELWDIMDPDRPLQRMKRVRDLYETYKRKKRESERKKRESDIPLIRLKRDYVQESLKRNSRDAEFGDSVLDLQGKLERVRRDKRAVKMVHVAIKKEEDKLRDAKVNRRREKRHLEEMERRRKRDS